MMQQAQAFINQGLTQVAGMIGAPALWPRGCGPADRDAPADACSCPPIPCCGIPLWFRDRDFAQTGGKSVLKFKFCSEGWIIENADVLGVTATIDMMVPCGIFKCGAESCCEPESHFIEGGKLIGKTKFLCVPTVMCKMDDYEMTHTLDGAGTLKFVRLGGSCCTRNQWRLESLRGNWFEVSFPIFRAGQIDKDPAAYVTHKYHMHPCCPNPICRPQWNGIKEWPAGITPDEQKMLISLVLLRHHMSRRYGAWA